MWEYKLLSSTDKHTLETEINQLAREGWELDRAAASYTGTAPSQTGRPTQGIEIFVFMRRKTEIRA